MKTKRVLIVFMILMAGLVLTAALFPAEFTTLLKQPALFNHALFIHALAACLFFGNALVGILWEARGIATRKKDIFFHTFSTVSWLDARFSAPLIIITVVSGLMLAVILGDLWQIGWLSLGFLLFLFSGLVWVLSDIPLQYKIKALVAQIPPDDEALPQKLEGLLRLRLWVSLAGVIPLAIVFALMVYRPDIPPFGHWLP